MKHLHLLKLKKPKIFYLTVLSLSISCFARAQKPTSLNYPAVNVFSANITSVYLAPTVSGNVTSYSISPALPAGLSLNTNTGAISGVATAASAATNYTVTATNASGSATKTISITVYNNFYNNNNGRISFDHTTAAASANAATGNYYNLTGTGITQGDKVLYKRVVTIGGIPLDCIVTTSVLSLGTAGTPSYTAYDQNSASDGSTFFNNDSNYFSPQFNFGTTAGGYAKFNFQFILGGSYVNAASPGTNVVLQNVKLNTYDIDGNGGANSYQYNEFGGFSSSELGGSGTTYATNEIVSYNATSGLTRYISNSTVNTTSITDPRNRIRVSYNNMSNFDIVVGAQGGGAAYFFLDFQAGATFTTIQTDVPAIDLNTNLPGVNNEGDACGSALSFTGDQTSGAGKTLGTAQTNILNPPATSTAIDSLTITYTNTAANLPNGINETIYIKGTTAGTNSFPLNFSSAGTASVTVAGLTFSVAKTVVSSTQNRISFSKSGFTLAQAETLIDSLQYRNLAGSVSSVGGDRSFTVNLLNSNFKSPDAIFIASLSCVAISGHIWHDADGLTDNEVDNNYTGTHFDPTRMYAVLTDASNTVKATTLINATTGAYTFGNQDPGKYNLYMYYGTSAPAATTTYAASTYPTDFKSTGENLGAGVGNDDGIDGKLTVTLGTLAVTEANFGIEMPPVTVNSTYSNIANPGGFNNYSVTSASFSGTNTSDADGSVVSITIASFPTGANYLKIGSVIYANPSGGTCPPQSTCTAWPGSIVIPAANIGTIAVDPTLTGTATVTIPFTALDNGGLTSNASTVSINFITQATPINISGNVWNDVNADGTKQAAENLTNIAKSGESLYAVLVQNTNTYSGSATIYTATNVSATTGYSFSSVPAGNDYEVKLISLATAPTEGGIATTATLPPALATGWTGVSTSNNGVVLSSQQNTSSLAIALANLSTSKTAQNFGIEMPPVTVNSTYTNIANPGGFNNYSVPSASFSGTNTSDADGSVISITITSFPTGANYLKIGSVIYANPSGGTCPPQSTCTAWPGSVVIPAANIGTIAVDPTLTGTATVTIPFTALDNGGLTSNASTVSINFITQATPINISGNVWNDVNADGTKQAAENLTNVAKSGESLYAVLVQNTNTYSGAATIYTATTVSATTGYSFSSVPAGNDYEVKLISLATAPTEGGIATTATLPPALATGWTGVSTSNNGVVLSSQQNTSSLAIALANLSATKTAQNFGIEALPTAVTATDASRLNPGGAVTSPVTGTVFSGTDLVDDPDGLVSYIHITAFPSNADHITVTGSATVGGAVTTVTYDAATFPAGGLYIASTANGNITNGLVAVDPVAGAVTVPVPYKVVDNARIESAAVAYANVPFLGTVSVSGNVWNDANGNVSKEAAENYVSGTNASSGGSIATGGNLYANLINSSGTVIATTQVAADGTYSFPLVQASTSGLKIQLSANTGIVNDVQPATLIPTGWVSTGKSAGATNLNASQSNTIGIIDLTTGTVPVTNQNFGLERTSSAVTQSYAMASQPAVGSSWTLNGTGITADPGPLKGSDPEDYSAGGMLSAKSVNITSLPAKGALKYGGAVITLGRDGVNPPSVTNPYVIASYAPASLEVQFTGNGYSFLSFSYAYVDLAGVQGTTATYTISLPSTLPVALKDFTAVAAGNTAVLRWTTATEKNVDRFVAERSTDNNVWTAIGTVKASGNSTEEKTYMLNDNTPAPGKNYYRLAMIDIDGKKEYSPYRIAEFGFTNAITFSLYPNPVHTQLYIKGITEKTDIRINNLSGNLVLLKTIAANEPIDVSHLAAGVYEVNINQHGVLSSHKLIVIR